MADKYHCRHYEISAKHGGATFDTFKDNFMESNQCKYTVLYEKR
jgi:hypothetical protein